jgi:hypothetical protein
MPTGRHRRPKPQLSVPRGAALIEALKEVAARHALTEADKDFIREHAGRWRRAILGELGLTPTEDAGAADAPPGEVIERNS